MVTRCLGQFAWILVLCLLVSAGDLHDVAAQGLPQSPYSAPSAVRGGLDLAPSSPLSFPGMTGGGSGSIFFSDKMLQGILDPIPNLQAGYLYSFGESVQSGRLTIDYTHPMVFGDSAVFGEAHTEWQDFWKTVTRGAKNRVDVSLGGGARTLLNENTLIGVNAFYDATRLGGIWYSSGSVGFEAAASMPGNDALDLSVNWYGNLFNSDVLANAFRRGPQNYDFEAGYSHEMWNGGPDLRLSATGYKFAAGSGVYGVRAGAEAKTRDGMFTLKYEIATDRINDTYHTVSATFNVGVNLEAVLHGESPFTKPTPIFKSPRNLRRLLGQPVYPRRGSGQPASIVLARVTSGSGSGGGPGPAPCVNPTGAVGPVGMAGQNPVQTVFIPFTGGCEYDNAYFMNATSVTTVLNHVFANMGSCGGTQAEYEVFWASSIADYGMSDFAGDIQIVDDLDSQTDNTTSHTGLYMPTGPVRGIVIRLSHCATAQISVDVTTTVFP